MKYKSINVEYNDHSRVETVTAFERHNRHGNAVIAIPFEILDELAQDVAIETDHADSEVECDGEVRYYHESKGYDRLLRHLFKITVDPRKWHVSVTFEVEAHSEEDASRLVEELIPYEADYHIENTQEAE